MPRERQLTTAAHGHILANAGVWSADGKWLVYDVRSDPLGETFDGDRIERVHAESLETQVIYRAAGGARCGVATCGPEGEKVVFIVGPEAGADDWGYSACHRRGVIADAGTGQFENLDARDIVFPYTPGALRGGTHLHQFSPDGQCVCFTYEDHVLNLQGHPEAGRRNVGVTVLGRNLAPRHSHPRNHAGCGFSVLVTKTTAQPRPGSDEISRACEESWIGRTGYVRADGKHVRRALAFQGTIATSGGAEIAEVFAVDVPDDVTVAGNGPLEGTAGRQPQPPAGCQHRRLSLTESRRYPGLSGPRHWLRSDREGTLIACLMRDDRGVSQIFGISPAGGALRQLTDNEWGAESSFTFSPEGRRIAYVMDGSVCVTDVVTGHTERLTAKRVGEQAPLPLACVFSPDGESIAYLRPVERNGRAWNQIFVVEC